MIVLIAVENMKLKSKKRKITNFQMMNNWEGSMSDIAFLLIIFFILTALFTVSYVIKIRISDNGTELVKKDDLIFIEMKDDGSIYFDNLKVDIETIGTRLTSKHKYRLKVSDDRIYQDFIDLVNIFYNNSIYTFEVITENEDSKKG